MNISEASEMWQEIVKWEVMNIPNNFFFFQENKVPDLTIQFITSQDAN